MSYCLTREQLLADLHQAYVDARRHKRQKPYQRHFERNVVSNLVCEVRQGVGFLGAFLKPGRRYVNNNTLTRMKPKISRLSSKSEPRKLLSTINSYLGLLSHYKSYHIRQTLFGNLAFVYQYGCYHRGMDKLQLINDGYRERAALLDGSTPVQADLLLARK